MTLFKTLMVGTVILALAAPACASAEGRCEREKHDTKVMGTLLGAIGGAALGVAVAGRGHQGDGALIGAAGGAVVGNQMSRSKTPCPDGYVYREDVAYQPSATVTYSSEQRREGWYDGYGRYCHTETESYYAPDGDYAVRHMTVCR